MSRPVAIGIGCRKGYPADAIETLILRALRDAPAATPIGLFTVCDKAGEAGLIEAARRLSLSLSYLSREKLRERSDAIQTPSKRAEALFGVVSVSEAAALAGAGPNSALIVPRLADRGAACAIAAVKEALT